MRTLGYTILHKEVEHKRALYWPQRFLGQVSSRPPLLECDRRKQASMLAADPSRGFPKQSLASQSREKGSHGLANGQNQSHK